jgi:PKHD-type hydroxylase
VTFYVFHNEHRPDFEPFCFFDKVFSEEECARIIAIGDSLEMLKSRVGGDNQDDGVRKSRNSWIDFTEETGWIFEKLGGIIRGANEARYKFQLTGFMEHLQYTVYDDSGSHYKLHTDFGKNQMAQRKLSAVLLLSDTSEYEGGELEIYDAGVTKYDRGTLVVFPAFQVHGVRPVTAGVRKSLVSWVSGEPFR